MSKDPELPVSQRGPPPRQSWRQSLRKPVDKHHVDIPILTCCFISGLCDSVAFNASGVFASMQTGNTIFLALGAASLPPGDPNLWLRALVSIISFWLGCLLFSHIPRLLTNPSSKFAVTLSFLLQALVILLVAALAQGSIIHELTLLPSANHRGEESPLVMMPVALLAFQFGGQIVASRILGINEVPTNVLTSLYCDLLSDPQVLAPLTANIKRNRRVVSMILILSGGIVGAWLQRVDGGMPAPLWVAGGVKLILAVWWAFWSVEGEGKVGGA